eukprot:5549644-Prymnesium_polylepis.1
MHAHARRNQLIPGPSDKMGATWIALLTEESSIQRLYVPTLGHFTTIVLRYDYYIRKEYGRLWTLHCERKVSHRLMVMLSFWKITPRTKSAGFWACSPPEFLASQRGHPVPRASLSPTTSRARVLASQRVGDNFRLLITTGNRFAPMRTSWPTVPALNPFNFPIPFYYTTRTVGIVDVGACGL